MRYATPLKSPITGCDFLCTNYFLRIWLHSKEPNIRSKIGVNINLRFFFLPALHILKHTLTCAGGNQEVTTWVHAAQNDLTCDPAGARPVTSGRRGSFAPRALSRARYKSLHIYMILPRFFLLGVL